MIQETEQCPTETQEAIALATWMHSRGIVFLHVANERRSDVAGYSIAVKMGVRPGFPDYLILSRTEKAPHGAAIELKRRVGGKRSRHQVAWVERLNGMEIIAEFCDGAREAAQFLRDLGY